MIVLHSTVTHPDGNVTESELGNYQTMTHALQSLHDMAGDLLADVATGDSTDTIEYDGLSCTIRAGERVTRVTPRRRAPGLGAVLEQPTWTIRCQPKYRISGKRNGEPTDHGIYTTGKAAAQALAERAQSLIRTCGTEETVTYSFGALELTVLTGEALLHWTVARR